MRIGWKLFAVAAGFALSGPAGAMAQTNVPTTVGPAFPAVPAVPNAPAASVPSEPAVSASPDARQATEAAGASSITSCFVSPAKLPGQEVEDFLADPSGIYDLYGTSAIALSNRVRSLAGSDRRTLRPILDLVAAANNEQKAAIGSGLGRAAFACVQANPIYAQTIQLQVAELNAPEVLAAFATASRDVQVAAIGAGPGSSAAGATAAGLSGGGLAGPFSAGLGGDEVVATTVTDYAFTSGGLVLFDDDDDDGDSDDVSPAN